MSERSAISGQLSALGVRLLLLSAFCLLPAVSPAEEIVFLQDGRAIHGEKVEIVGDRIRIERPSETIELPRSDVLSIHHISPPQVSPNVPAPAEVYRDMTQQMVDKVRREIQDRPEPSRRR